MVRPKRNRRIYVSPDFKGFSPIGAINKSPVIIMNFDEYEAIRLADYELLHQKDAALRMSISRPTFSRIYESARRKVAQAFVTGASIVFEGGKIYFDSNWFLCEDCNVWFNSHKHDISKIHCALCKSKKILRFSDIEFESDASYLSCPKCKRTACLKEKKRKIACPDCKIELQ